MNMLELVLNLVAGASACFLLFWSVYMPLAILRELRAMRAELAWLVSEASGRLAETNSALRGEPQPDRDPSVRSSVPKPPPPLELIRRSWRR
jgi:hypothetical protein